MTRDEIVIKLMLLEPILRVPQRYTPQQQHEIYMTYNAITGEQRAPNGCSSCLNTVITRLKKELRGFDSGKY